MYNQFEVVLVPFPYSDLTAAKTRPAIIVSNSTFNKKNDVLCCLVTSVPSKNGIEIKTLSKGHLPYKSWVKPHRIFTVDKRIIKKSLATISETLHKKIVKNLCKVLN